MFTLAALVEVEADATTLVQCPQGWTLFRDGEGGGFEGHDSCVYPMGALSTYATAISYCAGLPSINGNAAHLLTVSASVSVHTFDNDSNSKSLARFAIDLLFPSQPDAENSSSMPVLHATWLHATWLHEGAASLPVSGAAVDSSVYPEDVDNRDVSESLQPLR